jgi:mRNA-degrading endonuclease RelE of RelBE toxin-antitoxin system
MFFELKRFKKWNCKCIEFLTETICECVYCKEKYNVKNLDKHKCKIKLANIVIKYYFVSQNNILCIIGYKISNGPPI